MSRLKRDEVVWSWSEGSYHGSVSVDDGLDGTLYLLDETEGVLKSCAVRIGATREEREQLNDGYIALVRSLVRQHEENLDASSAYVHQDENFVREFDRTVNTDAPLPDPSWSPYEFSYKATMTHQFMIHIVANLADKNELSLTTLLHDPRRIALTAAGLTDAYVKVAEERGWMRSKS